jgi:hypothetical protein
MIIRNGTQAEVEGLALWSEENEGDLIEVAELDGRVVGFVQRSGAYIYFLESDRPGIGRALVEHVKEEMGDWLQACNVGQGCAGFWEKMGFEKSVATGERPNEFHYEWYAD